MPQQVTPDPSLDKEKKVRKTKVSTWLKISELILLFTGTILVVAILFGIYQGGPTESKYVDTSKFQAVFLNGGVSNGSVIYSDYFGHITALNNQFLVLSDVYLITSNNSSATNTQTNNSSSSSQLQLIKLGCQQLHAPYDQMIINRSQVSFWENLQNSGQVVKAIIAYQKANPNGPNCSVSTPTTTNSTTTPSSTSNSTTNSTTPATNNSTTNATTNSTTNSTTPATNSTTNATH